MTELSLFSGYCGFSLGLKLATPNIRTIGYVEWEKYPQQIIAARIKDGYLDEAPIFGDIRIFNDKYAESYRGVVDIITAGFPCQPFSVAGKQKNEADNRNMWPETIRAICTIRPRFIIMENVSGLLVSGYYGQILRDIYEGGYDVLWDCISAAKLGAVQYRKRLWLFAYPSEDRSGFCSFKKRNNLKAHNNWWSNAPKSNINIDGYKTRQIPEDISMGDGSPTWVDELKALGNGIVPAVVAEFLRRASG